MTGGVTEGLLPEVRGGSNFDAFRSPRGFGPQAIRRYQAEAVGAVADLGKDGGNSGKDNGCGCN